MAKSFIGNIKGPQGAAGKDGTAATVAIGTVTTGAAGTSASVTNGGTETNAVLNFVIPQGATGPAGPQGPAGTVPDKTSQLTNDSNFISSTVVTAFWSGTQAQYDAIANKSATTLYLITEE